MYGVGARRQAAGGGPGPRDVPEARRHLGAMTSTRRRTVPLALALAVTAVLAVALTACGSDGRTAPAMAGMPHRDGTHSAAPDTHDMPGMPAAGVPGDGLSDTAAGYRMTSPGAQAMPGMPMPYRFTITGPGGAPVTDFAVEQTQRLHFYAIRSDLTGFQHLHPSMAPDGTWTAQLPALAPGTWRLYASFTPAVSTVTGAGPAAGTGTGMGAAAQDLVLSRTLTVPGAVHATPLPRPAASTAVDGYTVTVKGALSAGTAGPLTVDVTRGGAPVTDLEPYLGTYAHLTAFHAGDQALAHLHPLDEAATDAGEDPHGGPELAFHAELSKPGDWRLFLQFKAGGALHTAALTLHVAG